MSGEVAGRDISRFQQDVPRGTAAQLEEYLFSEHSQHQPYTDRSRIFGKLVIWQLEQGEVNAELRQSYRREQDGIRETLPVGITPDAYLRLISGAVRQCMEGTFDEVTRNAVPSLGQLVQLASPVYSAYKIEAIDWAAAFGPEFLEQVRAV